MRGKKPKERERYVLYINDSLVEVTKEVYLECKFCSNGTPILKLAVHPF